MSVLIKGMEIPENCYDCPLAMAEYETLYQGRSKRIKNSYGCVITHEAVTSTRRNRYCPLISIPTPHGRLIDADALLNWLNNCMFPSDMVTTTAVSMAMNWIKDAPTVEEAEDGE